MQQEGPLRSGFVFPNFIGDRQHDLHEGGMHVTSLKLNVEHPHDRSYFQTRQERLEPEPRLLLSARHNAVEHMYVIAFYLFLSLELLTSRQRLMNVGSARVRDMTTKISVSFSFPFKLFLI